MKRKPGKQAEAGESKQTIGCAGQPLLRRAGLWCSIAGHWRTRQHCLNSRILPEMVLLYCVRGSGWLRVRGREFSAGAGDVLFCPANVEHGYGAQDEGWEIYWAHFGGRQAETLCHLAGLEAESPLLAFGAQTAIRERFAALIAALRTAAAVSAWEAAAALNHLLLCILRHGGGAGQEQGLAGLVDTGCADLDELAARAGYSKYHFCRVFKQQTGYSPWHYITMLRIERARALLLETRQSVKEIAAELGFPNADYFARIFAAHTGLRPTQYRGR